VGYASGYGMGRIKVGLRSGLGPRPWPESGSGFGGQSQDLGQVQDQLMFNYE
jgi:hypothetical protein